MKFFDIIIILGIIQGIFLGLSLLTHKRGNKKANGFLSLLMIIIALHLANSLLFTTEYYKKIPELIIVGRLYVFLFGPILFLYVKALTWQNFKINKKNI